MSDAERTSEGTSLGVVARGLLTLLGVHIQYAQQEAQTDIGRVIGGVLMLIVALMLVTVALLLGHAAAIHQIAARTTLGWAAAIGVVAAGDVLVAAGLAWAGRSRLRGPILKQTRSLVRRTFATMSEI